MSAQPSTRLIHGDDHLRTTPGVTTDIATSTTYRYPPPTDPLHIQTAPPTFDPLGNDRYIYTRITNPNMTKAEKLVGELCCGQALVVSSGLGAGFLALLLLNPPAVAIRDGYHGCHKTIEVFQRVRKDMPLIDLDDNYPEGTLCWLETPVNPTGESRDMQHYADKVHKAKGKLFVDATFAPPPLQDPFKWGADLVMHSGTKYFAGHSDALMGLLVVKTVEEWKELWSLRTFTGLVPGALENWLLLRSLRTMDLRVRRQAQTGTQLAQWLHTVIQRTADHNKDDSFEGVPAGVLSSVTHASLQEKERGGGFNAFDAGQLVDGPACFSIAFTDAFYATWFPHELEYFDPATSLGGVESLVEQRIMTDAKADPTVVRLSIGLEDLEDLKRDIAKACKAVKERPHP